MNEIEEDLFRRLRRALDTYASMIGERRRDDENVRSVAAWWALALEGTAIWGLPSSGAPFEYVEPQAMAARLLADLIPDRERGTSAFWATALGRKLATLGQAPADENGRVSSAIAAAVLGGTRQRVHELQKVGRLRTPEQIAAAMAERAAA